MATNEKPTSREIEVLRLIARGCSHAEVGEQLGISPYTVGTHVKNVYRKLDVHRATAAIARAQEMDLLNATRDQ